jgi:RNA polymerase sigma-70 factor (ECF subfamily)
MNRLAIRRWQDRSPQTEEAALAKIAEPLTAVALQEQYLTPVYRYVASRIGQRQEAEDVTAEVFAAAFETLHRYRGAVTPLAWLLGIARRKVADSLRRQSRRKETLEADMVYAGAPDQMSSLEESPQALVQSSESKRKMRELVSQLNSDQQEALLLQYVDGLPITDIAGVMGKSPTAVNSLLQRARAAIFKAGQGYFLSVEEVAK